MSSVKYIFLRPGYFNPLMLGGNKMSSVINKKKLLLVSFAEILKN